MQTGMRQEKIRQTSQAELKEIKRTHGNPRYKHYIDHLRQIDARKQYIKNYKDTQKLSAPPPLLSKSYLSVKAQDPKFQRNS